MKKNNSLKSYCLIPESILHKLQDVHIESQEDLIKAGSLETFLKIQSKHQGLTKSLLWKLYAIEHDLELHEVSDKIKNQLIQELKQQSIVKDFPSTSEMQNYMQLALVEAKRAYHQDEVPVGAVIVFGNTIVARAYNQSITNCDVTQHAEINAIKRACQTLKNYRLDTCDLYVTVEPCMMCTGAILQARIARVIYGITEPKTGMLDSFNHGTYRYMNHHTAFKGGVLAQECRQLLSNFFLTKRKMPCT